MKLCGSTVAAATLLALATCTSLVGCGSLPADKASANGGGGPMGNGVAEALPNAGANEPMNIAMSQATPAQTAAPDPSLAGTMWGVSTSRQGAGIGFSATDDRYVALVINVISDLNVQAMATVGTYQASAGTMTFTRRRTTCTSFPRQNGSDTYKLVDSDSLFLSSPTAAMMMKKLTPTTPPQMVVQWGCFDATSGAFTQGEWADL